MTAPRMSLPHDLQQRLDVMLAKPLLRRAPSLQQAIGALVKDAYARPPHEVLVLPEDALAQAQQARADLTGRLEEIARLAAWTPTGNSDTGMFAGYGKKDGMP
jgi:hypothetical protein